MNANKYLIFGVNINGVKHSLRYKWYDNDSLLVKTMNDWLPTLLLRVNSGGVNAGYEVTFESTWATPLVHMAYWYNTSMYYYVEVSETPPDFCPSPAIAHIYDDLDKAPYTLTQAQAFANLWDTIKERERAEAKARTVEEALDHARMLRAIEVADGDRYKRYK